MATGTDFETEETQAEPTEDPVEDLIHPSVIHLLAADYVSLPYEEALDKLKDDYSTINWEDKEIAARNFAEAADRLQQFNGITPDTGIKESFAGTLKYVLEEYHPEEEKLARIDEDSDALIANNLSNTEDVDALANSEQYGREVDAIRLYLRRGIISKDTSRVGDLIARGADAAVAPLAGTADALLDTDYRKQIRDYTTEITKPEYDDSMLSMAASFAGSIGGVAASSFVPYGVPAYLGAMLLNESKEVYDIVLAKTNDPEAAEQAMLEALPANVLGIVGDNVVGGMAGKLARGKGATTGAVKGFIAGGGTEATQEYLVGRTLTKYTDNPLYTPTEKELLKIFVVGGAFGGALGAAGTYRQASLDRAAEILKSVSEGTEIEVNGQKISDPQGLMGLIKQKVGYFQILNKKAENIGRPVEEVIAEENAGAGTGIFDEMQTLLVEEVAQDSLAEASTELATLPEAGADTNLPQKKLTIASIQKEVADVDVSDTAVVKYAEKNLQKPLEATTPEGEKALFNNIPFLELTAKVRQKSKQLLKEGMPAEEVNTWTRDRLTAIDEETWGKQAEPTPEEKAISRKKLLEDFEGDEEDFSVAEGAEPFISSAMPLPVSKENAIPFLLGTYIANEMGTELSVGFIKAGALGEFSRSETDAPTTIRLIRDLFKDPANMLKTFFHEFSHSVDSAAADEDGLLTDPTTKKMVSRWRKTPAFNKMLRIYKDFKALGLEDDAAAFTAEVSALDHAVMPYAEAGKESTQKQKDYTRYRKRGTEQFANAMSTILTNPELVRDQYPAVWKAFKKATEAHPRIKQLLELAERAKTDPSVYADIYAGLKKEGQDAETRIVRQSAQEKEVKDLEEKRALPYRAVKDFRKGVFSIFTHANDIGELLIKNGVPREEVNEMLTMLRETTTANVNMYEDVDKPVNSALDELEANVVDVDHTPEVVARNLANIMDLQHIINDTNSTVDDIQINPDEYKAAMRAVSEFTEEPGWSDRIADLAGEDLILELSKIYNEVDAPTRAKIHEEMVRQEIDAGARLFEDNTFEIRRLMANYGVDYYSAQPVLDAMINKIGNKKWPHYEKAITEIHQIGRKAITALDSAGLIDAKTKDKLVRNVNSYATQNVIKYFEKDARIPASIRKAIGSWEQTGNSLVSFLSKMKVLLSRAAFQETQNNIAKLAKAVGTPWREIEPKKHYGKKGSKTKIYYENLFDTRTVLEKKNTDKSYFITAEEGKLSLLEFDDPELAKMFAPSKLAKMPLAKIVTGLSDGLNKVLLAHWGKTLGSLPFVLKSPFRDVQREALVAGSKEFNWQQLFLWARHADPEMHAARKELSKGSWDMVLRGETSEFLATMKKYRALTNSQAREYGARVSTISVQQRIYSMLGEDIPEMENASVPDKINEKAIGILRKIPFIKWTELKAEADELTTKQMGFWIATEKLGKGPWEAGKIARDWFGTPDPTGGGAEMGTINKLFLFSRAHANGMRALGQIYKNDPKSFYFQYMYRKLIPRMLVSSALMGPIIGAMFGEEEEEIYRKYLNKIASYNKMGKNIIPIGFVDGDNNMRYFNVRAKDISADWKAAAIAIPFERDLISVDQLTEPLFRFMEDLAETGSISFSRIAKDVMSSMGQVFGGHMSPGMQTLWHGGLGEIAGQETLLTGNPQDYFRKKGILPKDIADHGSMYEKFTEYASWAIYNNYPSMFGRPTKKYSTEPTSPFDMITRFPQLGPALKGFTLVTNYGDIEQSKEAEQYIEGVNADLRSTLGPNTKDALSESSKYLGMMRGASKSGEKWRDTVNRKLESKINKFNRWRTRHYTEAFQDMREAYLAGNIERQNEIRDRLERNSTRLLERFKTD